MDAERRTHPRYDVWFPIQVDGGSLGVAVGISKDASAKGVRLDANTSMILGAPVRLRFRVSPHGQSEDVEGTVVRVCRNRVEQSDWPYQLAVEFDEPELSLDRQLRVEMSLQHPIRA